MGLKPAYELEGKPKLLIVDGAGTLFDPGSVVPAYAFQEAFLEKGIDVSINTIMNYMGRPKRDHVSLLLNEPAILEQFKSRFDNRTPNDEDIDAFYASFRNQLYPSAEKSEEIPGAKDAAYKLKESGIPLVMTTGYDRKTVDLIRGKFGWLDEVLTGSFTSDDVERGRPAPDLIYLAMKSAGVENPAYALKVGDTEVDVEASDNAHMPGALVLTGSVKDKEEARAKNEALGRNHLVALSLIEIIDHTIDGTIVDRIRSLNR